MSMLSITELVKPFNDLTALDGLSFTVEDGEFFALLGPSASGKTTTLRAICGIESLDSGRVMFDGVDMTHAPVQGRDMAMVFQNFALYPHLCLLALVMIFQPFSRLAFTAGCILVVVGGLAFNLVPMCTPGRSLRSLLRAAAMVLAVFGVVVLLALGSAFLYGIYLTG